ncbi:sugar kinase [Gracilibacillus caseinilyticus]|uniref:Sugar kinase n=1 Tax=Gracilibacillus caseinilyticus TaxID=2932256 RepID=A0ABY4EX29_9BACI|nr:sugar kinase [Gracilibacillus caseinilyticus]UOQ48393.1 sugar kinase [Gracilibacillus caseinilyticus]
MKDVITVGESMVLFTPATSPMMRYAETFSKDVGGAESNVAIGLARLGHNVGWISRLGNDEFGTFILNSIRGEGVDVSQVKRDDEHPTGLYFKEIRHAKDVRVQYYRKGSAASQITMDDIDETYWNEAKYLHLTGITPALSDTAYETMVSLMKRASTCNINIVFDPNLRRKLWPDEKARAVLKELIGYSDFVLPGMEEAIFLFGEENPERAAELFLEAGCDQVVIKLGEKGAYYKSKNKSGFIPPHQVKEVIDPVGAGDGFAAGFISGLLDGLPTDQAVKRANAVGAIQTQMIGDYQGLPDREELEQFMSRKSNQDVKR